MVVVWLFQDVQQLSKIPRLTVTGCSLSLVLLYTWKKKNQPCLAVEGGEAQQITSWDELALLHRGSEP